MIDLALTAMVFGLLFGLVAIVIGTNAKKGKMGLNLSSVSCPRCGEKMPSVRIPKNLKQALWGGGTCEACGCEMDKWGKEPERSRDTLHNSKDCNERRGDPTRCPQNLGGKDGI